ncbi:serine hydrolase [Marinicauda salina]|uniref:Serine hydrolase n=1 Tax=Marinicauda salina TaxID=2135793 RepID=A0A2U2BR29_9PROT|nr:serine hydrolase [Marinicauda salina]
MAAPDVAAEVRANLPSPAEEASIIASVAAPETVGVEPLILTAPPPYLDDVRERLDQAARSGRVVGLAAAVLEAGEPVLYYTHGETAAGSGEPVTRDTVFRAASLTKTFTGSMLALLEAQGRVDLSESVPADVITLKADRQPTWLELVSHQTGLPPNAYDNLIEAGRSPEEARRRLAEVDLVCPIGECYSYQNVAFGAAELLIEETTGLDYAEALRTYMFDPLGLDGASVGADALRASESWARPHRGWRRNVRRRAGSPDSYYDNLPAAAGVNLTIDDLVAWAQAHLDEAAGLPETVRERAFAPQIETPRETRGLGRLRARVDDTAYGMGWRIYHWGDRTLMMHSGYLSGYGAQVVLEPATGFAFVALWNADAREPWRLWPTVMDLRTGDGPGDWLDRL